MTTPAAEGFSMPAEWHPHERCWMAWPCRQELWGDRLDDARDAYAKIAQAIAEFEPVTMVANPEDVAAASMNCGRGVDVLPMDEREDPVENAREIVAELENFDPELAQRDRWLVLNKIDLLPADEVDNVCKQIVERLDWQGPVYRISAVSGEGTRKLITDIMTHLETLDRQS